MALNWTQVNASNDPIPIDDETFISKEPNAELTILMTPEDVPQNSKGKSKVISYKSNGTLYLSDERIVFVASKTGVKGSFDSFSAHYTSLLSTGYVQPLLGSNYIEFTVKPNPNGGLLPNAKGELRLKDKGIYCLVGTLEKSRERAMYRKRDELLNGPELPAYSSTNDVPVAGPSTVVHQEPTPSDLPPAYTA